MNKNNLLSLKSNSKQYGLFVGYFFGSNSLYALTELRLCNENVFLISVDYIFY